MEPIEDVAHDQARYRRLQNRVRPADIEARQRAAGAPAEQRRPVRISVLEIIGDGPGIGDPLVAVDQDRHAFLPRRLDTVLFREAPRNGFDWQMLVREREPDAPAIRTEP